MVALRLLPMVISYLKILGCDDNYANNLEHNHMFDAGVGYKGTGDGNKKYLGN
jgi:hypothetical protein